MADITPTGTVAPARAPCGLRAGGRSGVPWALMPRHRDVGRTAWQLRRGNRHRGVVLINLVTSRRTGLTTLLERTLERIGGRYLVRTIANLPDCQAVRRALEQLDLKPGAVVLLETALESPEALDADVGETLKIVVCDAREDPALPLRQPGRFADAEMLMITKADLAAPDAIGLCQLEENARRACPGLTSLRVSALTGQGMTDWVHWLDTARIVGLEAADAVA